MCGPVPFFVLPLKRGLRGWLLNLSLIFQEPLTAVLSSIENCRNRRETSHENLKNWHNHPTNRRRAAVPAFRRADVRFFDLSV